MKVWLIKILEKWPLSMVSYRVLRLYVLTVEPSQTLKIIVEYITKVYTPVWFAIKNTSFSQNGTLYLFKTIELTRMLIPDVRNIVYPVI